MRKNRIDAILFEQATRRNKIFKFICVIIIVSVLSFSLFGAYIQQSKEKYITYDESSNIDYKVFLKQNDFFENSYLESDKQYIASLIDYISANFKYDLIFDSDNVEYKYEYRIDANVAVYSKDTRNVIYSKTEELVPKKTNFTDKTKVSIKENVDIDYNHFNNLISKFVGIYDLEGVESELTIDMYINTIGSCEKFETNSENESVISLSIPLTTQTVAIQLSNDLIDTENNVLLCETSEYNSIVLILAILVLIIDIVLVIYIVGYEYTTRTAETIYMKKLKKILNNYGSYIQEIGDDFKLTGYKVIKINTFEDMLEIRDTIKQPILMKQNKGMTGTYFVIPSSAKYLYIYRMNIEDMEVKSFKK